MNAQLLLLSMLALTDCSTCVLSQPWISLLNKYCATINFYPVISTNIVVYKSLSQLHIYSFTYIANERNVHTYVVLQLVVEGGWSVGYGTELILKCSHALVVLHALEQMQLAAHVLGPFLTFSSSLF